MISFVSVAVINLAGLRNPGGQLDTFASGPM